MCQKCAKPKNEKNSTFRVSQQSSRQGVCQSVLCVPECFSSHSRPRQAQEPCPAFPSLLQLIPARSGPRSLAQLPRGSGRVPSIQGAAQRSYKAKETFSVPRDVPRWSPGHVLLQPLATVPRIENQMFSDTWKMSKLNIFISLFDI